MPIHPDNEAELLEAISEAKNASDVLLAAFDALEDSVDIVLQSIFRKDDFAVKFVVEPLLSNSGPLGGIMVRCKLLLGLGVIGKTLYDDLEIFVTLKEWAKVQGAEISFTDENIRFELNRITSIQKIMPIEFDQSLTQGLTGSMLDMFMTRYNQRVQSTIVLAITDMIHELCRENALTA